MLAAEVVQLKVSRCSSSNSIATYERVQLPHDKPYYKPLRTTNITADPTSKPEDAYTYVHPRTPVNNTSYAEVDAGKPTRACGEAVRFPTPQRLGKGGQTSGDGYCTLPPLPLHGYETLTEPLRGSSSVEDRGSDDEKPLLPPRLHNRVGRAYSRRKQPAPPPEQQNQYEQVQELHQDPTTPADDVWSVKEPSLQSSIVVRDLPLTDVSERSFQSGDESPTRQLESQSSVLIEGSDAEKPMLHPRLAKPVDRVNSRRKQPPPPPDQPHREYLEVQEPHAAGEEAARWSDDDLSVEAMSLQSTAADVRYLSVEDVAACLRQIHLDAFVDTFQEHGVDGVLLSNIDEAMLTTDFAMSRFEAKKLMMYIKHGWRPKSGDSGLYSC